MAGMTEILATASGKVSRDSEFRDAPTHLRRVRAPHLPFLDLSATVRPDLRAPVHPCDIVFSWPRADASSIASRHHSRFSRRGCCAPTIADMQRLHRSQRILSGANWLPLDKFGLVKLILAKLPLHDESPCGILTALVDLIRVAKSRYAVALKKKDGSEEPSLDGAAGGIRTLNLSISNRVLSPC